MRESEIIYLIKMIMIGLVQGFTEPIPVSSSGHVMIASEILVHSYGRNQQPYFRKNRS